LSSAELSRTPKVPASITKGFEVARRLPSPQSASMEAVPGIGGSSVSEGTSHSLVPDAPGAKRTLPSGEKAILEKAMPPSNMFMARMPVSGEASHTLKALRGLQRVTLRPNQTRTVQLPLKAANLAGLLERRKAPVGVGVGPGQADGGKLVGGSAEREDHRGAVAATSRLRPRPLWH